MPFHFYSFIQILHFYFKICWICLKSRNLKTLIKNILTIFIFSCQKLPYFFILPLLALLLALQLVLLPYFYETLCSCINKVYIFQWMLAYTALGNIISLNIYFIYFYIQCIFQYLIECFILIFLHSIFINFVFFCRI